MLRGPGHVGPHGLRGDRDLDRQPPRPAWKPVTPTRSCRRTRTSKPTSFARIGRRPPRPTRYERLRASIRAINRPGRRRTPGSTIKMTLYRTSGDSPIAATSSAPPSGASRSSSSSDRPASTRGEHSLGPPPRAGRRPRSLRPRRAQTHSKGARRSPRGVPACALRPHRDTQTKPADGAVVHDLGLLSHAAPELGADRHRLFNVPDRPRPASAIFGACSWRPTAFARGP